jgi:D-3-phosphoglycerate dehydrogenase
MAVNQLKNFLEKGNVRNSVNFPDCELDSMGPVRLVIANRNIPNMVGQYTSILASEKINILGLINHHKGDYAYNIIDIDRNISSSIEQAIKGIDGVIMVRVIDLQGVSE